eukprot:TRINITY_DN12753_c0_g1_i2.p1 TRINITY_DN12753_c0_g1~~TRINITY_DN12753_c0_g1_i2.p1  ORF type:complete len:438 (+),score=84.30 TRINITY_DN12753_c0_g1_i2:110-1423(+)
MLRQVRGLQRLCGRINPAKRACGRLSGQFQVLERLFLHLSSLFDNKIHPGDAGSHWQPALAHGIKEALVHMTLCVEKCVHLVDTAAAMSAVQWKLHGLATRRILSQLADEVSQRFAGLKAALLQHPHPNCQQLRQLQEIEQVIADDDLLEPVALSPNEARALSEFTQVALAVYSQVSPVIKRRQQLHQLQKDALECQILMTQQLAKARAAVEKEQLFARTDQSTHSTRRLMLMTHLMNELDQVGDPELAKLNVLAQHESLVSQLGWPLQDQSGNFVENDEGEFVWSSSSDNSASSRQEAAMEMRALQERIVQIMTKLQLRWAKLIGLDEVPQIGIEQVESELERLLAAVEVELVQTAEEVHSLQHQFQQHTDSDCMPALSDNTAKQFILDISTGIKDAEYKLEEFNKNFKMLNAFSASIEPEEEIPAQEHNVIFVST